MLKKRDEKDLSLEEYLSDYAAVPSERDFGFMLHLSRYDFFARQLFNHCFGGLKINVSRINLTGLTILDVGCGEGFGSYFLAKLGAKVIGIDSHKGIVKFAKEKYETKNVNVSYTSGNASDLVCFGDKKIDAICALDLIEHLSFPKKFFQQLKIVLPPNGFIVLSTPNHLRHLGEIYPFHEREFLFSDFLSFVKKNFKKYKIFGQCPGYIYDIYRRDSCRPLAQIIKNRFVIGLNKRLVPTRIKRIKNCHKIKNRNFIVDPKKLELNDIYNSIKFIQGKYETCSDFVLVIHGKDIK